MDLGTGIIFDRDSSKDHCTAYECFVFMGDICTLWNFCYQFYDRAAEIVCHIEALNVLKVVVTEVVSFKK